MPKSCPILHAITGCDTTAAFHRRGEAVVVKMSEKQESVQCAGVIQSHKKLSTTSYALYLSMNGAP